MRIAVCDDESSQLQFLSALTEGWGAERNHNVKIECFRSAEEFWFGYYKNKFDIILLDIQMDGENGIEVSKKLRAADDNSAIIFVTALRDYILDGYDVNAVHYLIKPIDKGKFFESLDKAAKAQATVRKKIAVQTEDGFINIFQDEIEAVEAFQHSCCVHTADESIEIREGYGDFISNLPPDTFVKCHRSYTANLARIANLIKYEVVLDSGRRIPISRRIFRDFSDKFISFYKEKN